MALFSYEYDRISRDPPEKVWQGRFMYYSYICYQKQESIYPKLVGVGGGAGFAKESETGVSTCSGAASNAGVLYSVSCCDTLRMCGLPS
jgi:hypothetical protein